MVNAHLFRQIHAFASDYSANWAYTDFFVFVHFGLFGRNYRVEARGHQQNPRDGLERTA